MQSVSCLIVPVINLLGKVSVLSTMFYWSVSENMLEL